jgi:hypothetical protein
MTKWTGAEDHRLPPRGIDDCVMRAVDAADRVGPAATAPPALGQLGFSGFVPARWNEE